MPTAQAKREDDLFREALYLIAEDIRDQFALEDHQRKSGVSSSMIDRCRADSYRRIVEAVEDALGINLNQRYHL